MSTATITLMFGPRAVDAEVARIAADDLRARGYTVAAPSVADMGNAFTTNAPRHIALIIKHNARVTFARTA